MTEAEVRGRIVSFGQCEVDPTLSAGEIDMLVDMAKRVDVYHIWPSDASWNPTWDVNFAIAQAWLLKAGRLSGAYLYMSGGKMLSRNQMYDHCLKQYRIFANKAHLKALRLAPDYRRVISSTVPLASAD
jgi:hypothetical protein